MTRISTIYVLSGALAMLAVMAPSRVHALEIKTPRVQMPHVNLPRVKPPSMSIHTNVTGQNVVLPGGAGGKTTGTNSNKNKGYVEINNFHYGSEQTGNEGGTSGGAGAGKSTVGSFTITNDPGKNQSSNNLGNNFQGGSGQAGNQGTNNQVGQTGGIGGQSATTVNPKLVGKNELQSPQPGTNQQSNNQQQGGSQQGNNSQQGSGQAGSPATVSLPSTTSGGNGTYGSTVTFTATATASGNQQGNNQQLGVNIGPVNFTGGNQGPINSAGGQQSGINLGATVNTKHIGETVLPSGSNQQGNNQQQGGNQGSLPDNTYNRAYQIISNTQRTDAQTSQSIIQNVKP